MMFIKSCLRKAKTSREDHISAAALCWLCIILNNFKSVSWEWQDRQS